MQVRKTLLMLGVQSMNHQPFRPFAINSLTYVQLLDSLLKNE